VNCPKGDVVAYSAKSVSQPGEQDRTGRGWINQIKCECYLSKSK
jgi:hypothetical protein